MVLSDLFCKILNQVAQSYTEFVAQSNTENSVELCEITLSNSVLQKADSHF
jgi:hypothetical protein